MQYLQIYFECFRESGMKSVFSIFRMQEITSAILQFPDWRDAENKISINIKLLFSLDQTSRDIKPPNRVSFTDLKISNDTKLEDLQEEAKAKLKKLNYWGTILNMWLSFFFVQ